MAYEEVHKYIGEIGKYQWIVFIAFFFITIFTTDAIHMVFIGGSMDHWCRVDELKDLSYDVQKNVAIPSATEGGGSTNQKYSSCQMFALNYSVYNRTEFESWDRMTMVSNGTPTVRCEEWAYDQSTFISTIVSKVE
jgi:hypothetical protein